MAPPQTGQQAPGGIIAPSLHFASKLHFTDAHRGPNVFVNNPISRHSPS